MHSRMHRLHGLHRRHLLLHLLLHLLRHLLLRHLLRPHHRYHRTAVLLRTALGRLLPVVWSVLRLCGLHAHPTRRSSGIAALAVGRCHTLLWVSTARHLLLLQSSHVHLLVPGPIIGISPCYAHAGDSNACYPRLPIHSRHARLLVLHASKVTLLHVAGLPVCHATTAISSSSRRVSISCRMPVRTHLRVGPEVTPTKFAATALVVAGVARRRRALLCLGRKPLRHYLHRLRQQSDQVTRHRPVR
mmetsp:Transcript_16263/g.27086  ORF Transcript_16263/g.27086 Transcript_16263/m.27086 type:complete len:245 (+) Transcript_16263:865-1599(+)